MSSRRRTQRTNTKLRRHESAFVLSQEDAENPLATLTVKGFAAASGLQVWRVHELVTQGKAPPHFRIGRTIRFRVADVAEWMKQQVSK